METTEGYLSSAYNTLLYTDAWTRATRKRLNILNSVPIVAALHIFCYSESKTLIKWSAYADRDHVAATDA
jgi:hypothetical protein